MTALRQYIWRCRSKGVAYVVDRAVGYRAARVMEVLEPRRLLSISVENLRTSDGSDAAASSGTVLATVVPQSLDTEVVGALTAVGVDAASVRDGLIRFADTWNGGQFGKLGTSGMGTYAASWDGLFRMNLDRQFNRFVNTFTDDMTIISQSRAIYMNVEAYRNAPAADQPRFKAAVQRGADYLLGKAVDPGTYSGKPGGMWWGLQPDGVSPPTHTTQIGGTPPRHKHAYGQVQSMFALAHAYTVTGDIDHLNAAFAQLDVWNTQFADTAAGPGAFLQTANENYTQRIGNRNLDYMTHALEGLMTLHDVTPASDPRKASLATQVTNIGDFITTRMYRDAPDSTTMGYLPWYYDAQWNPSSVPAERHSTPGHNFEVAFLLSRAVERGFNANWLNVANKLVTYTLQYSFDNVSTSPTYGAVPHEKLAFDGSRFDDTPDDLVWWQQSEAARTLLHFALVRGRTDLWDEYEAASAFIESRFVDPVYGGWYQYLNPSTLAPTTTMKGTVWTGGYHETMLDAERIRLGTTEADVATFPASADAYVRDGTYAGQNFGTAADLVVKRSANVGNTRETYLRFSLAGIRDVVDGKLRLFGRSTTTQNVALALYPVGNVVWSEGTLNWNNKPASASTPIATQTITGTTGRWYVLDVTPYLRQQREGGATAVSFVLKATGVTDAQAVLNADENAAGKPELVVRHTPAVQPQGLVVSTSSIAVPEGGNASFTVKLAAQPGADVQVTVARQAGDTDLTGGGTLVFTPSNWNTPQSVSVAAANDADSANGSAVFAVSSAGLETKLLTANEVDDDVVTPVIVRAAADAYVRDGTYAGQNFGTAADLVVKRSVNVGNTRESYLRFSLSDVPAAVGSAKLRLFGRSSTSNQNVGVALYPASNVTWAETGLTWSNKPVAGVTAMGTKTVSGIGGTWYEFDVATYVQQQKSAGASAVTFVLKATSTTDAQALFTSDEGAANQPQFAAEPATDVPQAIVLSASSLTVPEGGTASFTVRLARPPVGETEVVSIFRESGDMDLTADWSDVFTQDNWNVPRTVPIFGAQDADSINGTATFTVQCTGADPKNIVATEADDDVVSNPVMLRPAADAFVRDGSYASTNFGTNAQLQLKKAGTGWTRETYLRFNLTAVTQVNSAKLRLFGKLDNTTSPSVAFQVFSSTNTTWSESAITWNNRPAAANTPLAGGTVVGTGGGWYEVDLTTFIRNQKAAGAAAITLVLRAAVTSNATILFNSDEATTAQPQLVVT